MASAASELFQLLVRTGVKFRDDEWDQDFQLTVDLDAAMMVLSERQHSEWHTSPQVEAVARIIVEVAVQATEFNKVFGYAPSRPSTFEEVVTVMDQIASAVGPLADYRQFHMDEVTALKGLRTMFGEQWGDLFNIKGKCNSALLKECLSRLIFIYYPDYVEDSTFLKDATTATLSRTVKRSKNYDFVVCKVDRENSVFIKRLAKQLEKAQLTELRAA